MRNWYSDLKPQFSTFSPDVQILHAVSELTKAKHLAAVDRTSAINHVYRAMILLDYMVADPKWRPRCRELLRLREAIGSFIFYEQPYGDSDQMITAALQLEPKAYRALRNNL